MPSGVLAFVKRMVTNRETQVWLDASDECKSSLLRRDCLCVRLPAQRRNGAEQGAREDDNSERAIWGWLMRLCALNNMYWLCVYCDERGVLTRMIPAQVKCKPFRKRAPGLFVSSLLPEYFSAALPQEKRWEKREGVRPLRRSWWTCKSAPVISLCFLFREQHLKRHAHLHNST